MSCAANRVSDRERQTMANNTKSNRPKIGDLNILAVMATLRLDVAADYRRYMKEKRAKKPKQFDAFQNMRYYVVPDNEVGEMRVFMLAHPVAPMAFYTRQGAQDSMDKHQAEWRQLFKALTPEERSGK